MQAASLFSQLGETHGVLVYHDATLLPDRLQSVVGDFGNISSTRTYTLTDSNYATVVFFSEAAHNVDCYTSLSLLAHDAPLMGIKSVGWLHETDEEAFAQKSYVQGPFVAPVKPQQPTSSTAAPSEGSAEGYVAVYWSGVAAEGRAAVTQLLRDAATEVFEDEKEGGRAFARFPNEDAANAFHSHVCQQHPAMRRCLSYADANDFKLAKRDP